MAILAKHPYRTMSSSIRNGKKREMAMDRLLVLVTRPLLTTMKLVDEMIAASSIEAAAAACAEIERRKALKKAVAELERPRLTTGAA